MVKNILVININESNSIIEERIKEILRKFKRKNIEILYLNENIINKSVDYLIFDDLVKPEDSTEIYKDVNNFLRNWYKPIEKDFEYFNLSLCNLAEMDSIKVWSLFLKIDKLFNFLSLRKPSNVHLITEYDEDVKVLDQICKTENIKFSYYKTDIANKDKFSAKIKNFFITKFAELQNYHFKLFFERKHDKNYIGFIGNLRQTSNLLEELKKDRRNVVIRMGEDIGNAFSEYNNYYVSFKYFNTKRLDRKLIKAKKFLNENWNKLKSKNKFKDKLFYRIHLYDIMEEHLKKIILKRFYDLIRYIELMKYFNKRFDIIVTHNDILPFEKTIVQTSNKFGIPTLTMIEGFLPEKIIEGNNFFIPFSSSKMALFSYGQKDSITKKYKISKDRLEVAGYPEFDKYYNKRPVDKKEIYEAHNINPRKRILFYTAERYNKDKSQNSILGAFTKKQYENVIKELFYSVKDINDVFLIIKKHPSGSEFGDSNINDIADRMGFNDYIILDHADLYSLINASTVVITRLSNIGLESMILGKPVIIFDTYFDTSDYFDYTKFGAALHAKKKGELKKVLNNLLEKKSLQKEIKNNIKKFVKHNYSFNDGNSSMRFVKIINKMIKSNSVKDNSIKNKLT